MIAFSNTTTKRGLVQKYEKAIGANYGDVSGNEEALLEFVAACNDALDNYHLLWASADGTWQGDDQSQFESNGSTQRGYPIITANIVSGTRDYQFTQDDNGNRITDVQKVLILPSATATRFVEISPVDELNTSVNDILLSSNQGVPNQYGKLSNAIFLDPVPNYSVNNGIKMIVHREGSYFTSADTTKVPGVPVYHEYFYLKPAYEYARIKGLSNLNELEKAVIDLEGSERLRVTGKIVDFFGKREKDTSLVMTGEFYEFE